MILDTDDLAQRGIDAPFGWADSVRFSELDPLGHVNNAAYLSWFEAARVRSFFAWSLTAYAPGDPSFVVRRIECDYLTELKLHDAYVVTVATARIGRTSFTQTYGVHTEAGLAATGSAVVVMLRDGRPAPLTDEMKAGMA